MGQSWTSGRRRNDYYYSPASPSPATTTVNNPTPVPVPAPNQDNAPPPLPAPSAPLYSSQPSFQYYPQPTACSPYPTRPYSPHPYPGYYSPAPPPPPPGAAAWWHPQPVPPNYPSTSSAWAPPGQTPPPPPQPPVEILQARTVKNEVNVHKETIRLEPDDQNPDQHLVSFTFDAVSDGSIAIFYFAKEGGDGNFSSVYRELSGNMRIPFQKGLGQKFRQPPGSSVDLGFFDLHELSNPVNGSFPLVICAEAGRPDTQSEQHDRSPTCAQITEAVIDKKGDGSFQVKVIKQILRVDGQQFELQDIFGLGSSSETTVDGEESEKECVICLSEPRNTTVLPCRHLCMCSECANELWSQSNKCPICRQPVEKLMEIKVGKDDP